MDTILIIGGRLHAIQKAQRLGLRVVLVQHRDRLLPGQAETADALLLIDYLDHDVALPLISAAHEVYQFTAVVSLVDQAMELVGRINDMLDLGGTSYEVSHRFVDKSAMRAWLDKSGFEDVAAREVASAEELRDFADRCGYPVVLKPVDGTGSRGVLRIDGPLQVDAAWRESVSLRQRDDLPMAKFYPVTRFIAEEYIDGPEFSVEGFSFDGRHIIVTITDKLSEGVVEIGHAQPAALTPADEAALERHVVEFLDVMGLRDGVSCTEIKLSSKGPRIIEGHNRAPGDRLMDLMIAVFGVDLEEYAVGWPFRRVTALVQRPEPARSAATRFLKAEPGRVVAVEGVDEVRAHPDVIGVDVEVRVGDLVSPMNDNFVRPGQVLVTATDTAAAVALAGALAERIRIHTAPISDAAVPSAV